MRPSISGARRVSTLILRPVYSLNETRVPLSPSFPSPRRPAFPSARASAPHRRRAHLRARDDVRLAHGAVAVLLEPVVDAVLVEHVQARQPPARVPGLEVAQADGAPPQVRVRRRPRGLGRAAGRRGRGRRRGGVAEGEGVGLDHVLGDAAAHAAGGAPSDDQQQPRQRLFCIDSFNPIHDTICSHSRSGIHNTYGSTKCPNKNGRTAGDGRVGSTAGATHLPIRSVRAESRSYVMSSSRSRPPIAPGGPHSRRMPCICWRWARTCGGIPPPPASPP
jgi:hypothetical protein